MFKFEAVLVPLSSGQWKMILFFPKEWGHAMKFVESAAGLTLADAQFWADQIIHVEGFSEQFGWYPLADGKYKMRMTVKPSN